MPAPLLGKQDGQMTSFYSFKTIIMRNYLLSLLVALLAVTGSLPVAAQKAYAVLTPDDRTLTFYYDNQYAHFVQNYEHIYDMPQPGMRPAWAGIYENPQRSIKHVVFDASFSRYRPTSTLSWFEFCINLQDIKGIRNLNTEKVTNMSAMFDRCEELTSIDVSNFNTEKVTRISEMFRDCKALTSLDVSNFNTQNVTDMGSMFEGCEALTSLDVSNFNTQNVTYMNSMFEGCKALTSLDVSKFNTKKVKNMSKMFNGCKALTSLNLSNFNTQNVFYMNGMFEGCEALKSLDVSSFNTQNVTDMSGMFSGCKALKSLDVSNFNAQNVKDMYGMFEDCKALTSLDLSNFNTEKITGMVGMFRNCKALTSLDLSNFNTQYVTDMSGMFEDCQALTSLDLSKFNTPKVRNMYSMFYGCTSLTTIFCNNNWKVGHKVDDQYMFYNCTQLKGTNTAYNANKTGIEMANPNTGYFTSLPEPYAVLTPDGTLTFYYDYQRANHQNYEHIYDMPTSSWDTPTWVGSDIIPQKNIKHAVFDASFAKYRPTSTVFWFTYCINLQDIEGMRNLNTENVTNMRGMFDGCKTLTSLDVSNFNTQKVTDMSFMFSHCQALTSLDVSKFNTQNVTGMSGMFDGCKALTSLDVSNFNTKNVTDMGDMFSGCRALISLDVSKFNTQNVTHMNSMFLGCQALTSLDVSKFNTQNVTNMSYMFSYCSSLTTIFCNSDWNVGRLYNDNSMFKNCTQLKGTNTSFDENKTGIEMANPTTGYFTSKTTGIDHVKTADRAGDGKAYDLSGRRVNESYKGIVIKNGKKYIQK